MVPEAGLEPINVINDLRVPVRTEFVILHEFAGSRSGEVIL